MGVLPSQKYCDMLKEFCEYVKQEDIRIGESEETDDKAIREFLDEKDNGKTFYEFEPEGIGPAVLDWIEKRREKRNR